MKKLGVFLSTFLLSVGVMAADVFNFQDTWNDGATTWNAIKVTITDTGSAADSKMINIIRGANIFYVDRDANLSLTGTVDGRDIAADGIKLDGVEPLADVTDTANVTTAGAFLADGSVALTGYADFTPSAAPAYTEGRAYYDSAEFALSYYNEESDVTINLGQESVVRVRNATGSDIPDGTVVYISGSTGEVAQVTPALSSAVHLDVLGLTTHSIENNTFGYITTFGMVRGVNTVGLTAGDVLYVSASVAGDFTEIKPTFPDEAIEIGVVIKVAAAGKIFVTARHLFLEDLLTDTSPQLGGALDVNSFNITMTTTETVDGRDVSVDGTKLDGIESGAQVNVAPEGTAVVSTGISVGWVLQADGDNTSSWIALSGGGDALTANSLSQFAATTSAQLAGVLSDETGSGLLVFGTSPTLVTPALGTPASGVLTNVTGLPVTGLANGTDGELITWSATGVAETVAVGTSTHVLTSNGIGLAPTFQASAGGGGWADMTEAVWAGGTQSEVADGATAVAFDFDTDNTYATSGANLARFSNNGTAVIDVSFQGGIDHANSGATTAAHSQSLSLNWSASGTQTSSGQYSAVIGKNNTATGYASFAVGDASEATDSHSIAFGKNNTASNQFSVAFGQDANATNKHSIALGGDSLFGTVEGHVQSVWSTLRASTTDATQTTMTPGAGSTYVIPADTSWAFSALIIGRSDEADGNDSAAYRIDGLIARDESNNTVLVGSVTKTVIAESAGATAWDVTASADDTNEVLAIQVTGEAATNVKWVCKLDVAHITNT